MQDSATTWDLRNVDYTIDGATQIYLLFLLVVAIWSVIASVRFWWMTSAFRSESRVNLSRCWSSFMQNDFDEVRRLSSNIPARLPEYGISAWSRLNAQDPKSAYIESFSAAQAHFQYAVSKLGATSRNLYRLMMLTLILTASWLFDHVFVALKGIVANKSTGIFALAGALAQIAAMVSSGVFLVALLYVLRWWMTARIDRRNREWERFAGLLQSLSATRT